MYSRNTSHSYAFAWQTNQGDFPVFHFVHYAFLQQINALSEDQFVNDDKAFYLQTLKCPKPIEYIQGINSDSVC